MSNKLKANGTKYPDKSYQTRDDDGDLNNYGDTASECMRNVYIAGDQDDTEVLEIAEYTLTSVKKYRLKYEAEEAN